MSKANEIWKDCLDAIYLCAVSIYPDLKCFTYAELVGLFIFASASVVFSFISFDHLYDPVAYPSIYNVVNDRLYGIEPWRRNMKCVNGGAAFTGVMSVVLVTKGKISTYFWGVINSVLYGLFAWAYGKNFASVNTISF
jgi:nicotinamide mononucleotide transporter